MKRHSVFLILLAFCCTGYTQPYYDWVNEYDGTEPGTMACWSFNEDTQGQDGSTLTAADISGNGHAAYLNTDDPSMVYFATDGKWGDCAYKEQGATATQVIEVPSSVSSFFAADQSLSLEAWVRFDDLSVDRTRYIISTGYPGSDGKGFAFYMNGGTMARFYFAFGESNTQRIYTSDILFEEGRWYHCAATWNADTDTAAVYRDGVKLKTLEVPGYVANFNDDNPIQIGSDPEWFNPVNGAIDSVRISNIAYNFSKSP